MTSDTFDDLRDLYQEVILDHGRRPRHARRLESFDATAKGDNPMCGDRIEVWVKYAPDGTIAPPPGPGLGVTPDLDALERWRVA